MTRVSYQRGEHVSFSMERVLYEELFECEIEPYDLNVDMLRPSHIQFIQGMLQAEEEGENRRYVTMTNDGIEYLLRRILPENMERWYSKMDVESDALLLGAQELLEEFGLESFL